MICKVCNIDKPLEYYELRSDTNKYRTKCCDCRAKSRGFNSSRKTKTANVIKLFESGYKECGKCKNVKSIDQFHYDKGTLTKLTSWCISCKKSYQLDNIDNIRNARLLNLYNITLSDYNNMLFTQDNKCAICPSLLSESTIHVDHCHSSGKVRGLLCSTCNLLLGHAKDDKQILTNAIEYLSKYEEVIYE